MIVKFGKNSRKWLVVSNSNKYYWSKIKSEPRRRYFKADYLTQVNFNGLETILNL